MCRSIKTLFNFDPPATDREIEEAAIQFVRKLSGFRQPSKSNEDTFNNAVKQIAHETKILLDSLSTESKPRNREVEAQRAHKRALKRFGSE